jgi:phosphoribosylglycinamide formyltransferase-1
MTVLNPSQPLKVAVLISGGGTTLKNLIDLQNSGELPIEIVLVISSKESAGGLNFSRESHIPSLVIRRKDCVDAEAYRDAIFAPIRQSQADYAVMGGFLQHLLVPSDFRNRVVNIHPSLIPAFSGYGYYGLKVHQAAIDYGVKLSGCTVHFVDDHYDHGPVILQQSCPVLDDDTAESLQKRVFALECKALPEVLQRLAEQRIRLSPDGRRVLAS